jgi:hypothetical protein
MRETSTISHVNKNVSVFLWQTLRFFFSHKISNLMQFSMFVLRNSKPLLVSEGYWAEPWPVADTPLCAVIDPARDYRWHALRCGGPETAAFLCEMESKFAIVLRSHDD